MSGSPENLKKSAAEGLLWGAMFTLGRDVLQFASMIVLVRLLSPEIYGQFALAQTILLFLAVFSLKTFAPFALQSREIETFDWDAHFSAGVVLNASVTGAMWAISAGLFLLGPETMRPLSLTLFVLSFTFIVEIIGTTYHTWLQAHHRWRHMRTLVFLGAILSTVCAVVLAWLGAGVLALASGPVVFGVPLVIDFFVRRPFAINFLPDWWSRYSEGRTFGLNRVLSTSLTTGSTLAEQSVLSTMFGFGTLGIYTRAVGLAQITSGRVGPIVTQTLYPVLTRAEANTERFRRFADILFKGVLWVSAPAALFLALEAESIVRLLYGEKWLDVIPLMAAGAALLALRGLHLTMNQIMLANLQQKACLTLDAVSSISLLVVILSIAFMGPQIYLIALSVHAAIILFGTSYMAIRGGAVTAPSLIGNCAASVISLLISGAITFFALSLLSGETSGTYGSALRTLASGLTLSVTYICALSILAPRGVRELLSLAPIPKLLPTTKRS
ncbi:MAG: oligosaccharide flippase family protein [Pseudomonadota bacterium]